MKPLIRFKRPLVFKWAIALVAVVVAGAVLSELGAPLPWMIGPMLTVAVANAANARLKPPRAMRAAGQWLIGTALGLYFTLPVLERIVGVAGWILLILLGTGMITLLCARLLQRFGGIDPATAFFACMPGGATEMAILAERQGARVDQVVAAQALRVLLVVIIVPFAFQLSGLHGSDPYQAGVVTVETTRLLGLLALTGLGGALLARMNVPNAWSIGPLLLTAVVTAMGIEWSAMPRALVNLGQMGIGCALGARFSTRFFREAPRFMLAAMVSSLVLLAGFGMLGLLIAWFSSIPWPTAILATAPGGLSEMSLTAKTLQLGVPIVVAFQVVRMVSVVLGAGMLWRVTQRWWQALKSRDVIDDRRV